MMMVEFKVGDRVRYTPCKGSDDAAWQNVTITKVDNDGYWGDDVNPNYRDGHFPFSRHSLELIRDPIPTEIAERMRVLVERMAGDWGSLEGGGNFYQEARSIMAALKPEPDPDATVAMEMAKEVNWFGLTNSGLYGRFDVTAALHKAIRRGRELEREEE